MVTESMDTSRQLLLSRFVAARAETDELFRIVRPEAMYDRPIPERHRVVFYVGHLEAFDWNLLNNPTSPHSEFDRLFAFGIDPVGGNLPTDVPGDWPQLRIVIGYRDHTRENIDQLLAVEAMRDEGDGTFEQKMNVAIEHRLMHAETLAYIFHQMPFDRKQGSTECRSEADSVMPGSVRVPAGQATPGLPRRAGTFGWDNEFDRHTVDVPEFEIDKYKVNNGEFLQFLRDGGYGERSLWAPVDWEWRTSQNISHPVFWIQRGDNWSYRSMFDELPLPAGEPVYVSHAEASAYARWARKVLPTEGQWHRTLDDGSGVEGMIGTGWEWTSTEFAPFPGFQAMPFYLGYSEPFFDGKHFVLKGGSPRTAPVMLRPSFRNWFQPHYQYVYAGFRCAEKEDSK